MEALLNGKRVKLSGAVYEPPRHSPGREWTMVQEAGCRWWKPAWMDQLKEIPDGHGDEEEPTPAGL
jgi:hypothetical protein